MKEEFDEAFASALARGAALESLIEIVQEHADRGLTQGDAYDVLKDLRSKLDESDEDRVLEVMDVVVGWCQPRFYIWPNSLSEN